MWVAGSAGDAVVPLLRAGSGSTASRSCCAGTGRSPTSPGPSRSRRASSSTARGATRSPDRRVRSRYLGMVGEQIGAVLASRADEAPPHCPADGAAATRDVANPTTHPSPESRVTVASTKTAPTKPAPRPAPRRPPAPCASACWAGPRHVAADRRGPRPPRRDDALPERQAALRDVDLVVPEGDFVFLVGPSGAGKSTLTKLLIRDELATKGMVILDGDDLAGLPAGPCPRCAGRSASCSRTSSCCRRKTVWENVAFALEVTGTPRRKIRPAVDRVLALVGLTAQADQIPPSFPAVSSSGPRSPARSSTTRGSSSRTSRPGTSTR